MIIRIPRQKPPKPQRQWTAAERKEQLKLMRLRAKQKRLLVSRRSHRRNQKLRSLAGAISYQKKTVAALARQPAAPQPYRGVKPSLLLDPAYVPPPEARIQPPKPPETPPIATVANSTACLSPEGLPPPQTPFNKAALPPETMKERTLP